MESLKLSIIINNVIINFYAVGTVGLKMTFYQVDEDAGFVEICAVVLEPTIICPIDFDFSVSLSPLDGSAGVNNYNYFIIIIVIRKSLAIIIIITILYA